MVTKGEVLDIVEIIFYTPLLPVTIYVCSKHGFKREGGWLLLTLLSLVRLLGGALGIAATENPTTGLVVAALVLTSIGSTFLVAALTAIVNRIETGSGQSHIPPRIRRYLGIIAIVAIVMGSIGGSKITSSDPETVSSGYTYFKVAAVLILIQYLATVYILSCSARNMRAIQQEDRKLFYMAAASCPFILVRIIYSLCTAFDHTSTAFNSRSNSLTAIVLRAVLSIAMEIIGTTLLVIGGILAPKIQSGERIARGHDTHLEPYTPKGPYEPQNNQYEQQNTQYEPPQGHPPRY